MLVHKDLTVTTKQIEKEGPVAVTWKAYQDKKGQVGWKRQTRRTTWSRGAS